MIQPDEKKRIIIYNLNWFLLTGICLGLLVGLMISLNADNIEEAGTMARYFFDFLTFIIFIELLFLTYKKRTYWLTMLQTDPGQGIGQAIGIAVGGGFVASLLFLGLVVGLPYLIGSFDTPGYYTYLTGVITLGSQFILVGIAVLATLLALAWLWWRQKRKVADRDAAG